jgi:hypothetical protein
MIVRHHFERINFLLLFDAAAAVTVFVPALKMFATLDGMKAVTFVFSALVLFHAVQALAQSASPEIPAAAQPSPTFDAVRATDAWVATVPAD